MSKVNRISENTSVIHSPVGVYAVSIAPTGGDWQSLLAFDSRSNWESDPSIVMGKRIVPYGLNNDLPVIIRKVMDDNNLETVSRRSLEETIILDFEIPM